MSPIHIGLFAGGAAVAGILAGLANNGILHKAAVAVTTQALACNEAVAAETQSIMDEAADNRAEAQRQAKIDAAVAEELAKYEDEIREKIAAKVDEEAAKAAEASAKKSAK